MANKVLVLACWVRISEGSQQFELVKVHTDTRAFERIVRNSDTQVYLLGWLGDEIGTVKWRSELLKGEELVSSWTKYIQYNPDTKKYETIDNTPKPIKRVLLNANVKAPRL